MPTPDETASPARAQQPETGPAGLSRRSMLRSAAGAGAAGLAMTAMAGPALAADRPARPSARPRAADHDPHADDAAGAGPVVVHVRDVRSGEMDLYRGTSHVRIRDQALAARLARGGQ